MNVVLMLAHSIEEWHQVRLMHDLGHNVFSIGAYIDPGNPGDDKRPSLPDVPFHADLARAVWATPAENGDSLWAAKDRLPDDVVEWGDVFICHHVEWRWITQNFDRLRAAGKRVIWRTVGQSSHENEARMKPYRERGLEIVRYSPNERFIPGYLGEDALIRFWVDRDELSGWTGEDRRIGNVTQDMRGRSHWTGWSFWEAATAGLPAYPAGPKSDLWGGAGSLSYDDLRAYLRSIRCYLMLSTFPASYTLGFLEALMTGTPVVAAGPGRWRRDFPGLPYGSLLLEAHQIAPLRGDAVSDVRAHLEALLTSDEYAQRISEQSREIALRLFDRQLISQQWQEFLK